MQVVEMESQNPVTAGVQDKRPATLDGLAAWILDRVWTGWRDRQRRPRAQLLVVETLHLGSRKQLLLVSCYGERFLVGTGAETVQTIVRVGAAVEIGRITDDAGATG